MTLNEEIIAIARAGILVCETRIAAIRQETRDEHEAYGLTPRERYDDQRSRGMAQRSREGMLAALQEEIAAKQEQIAALS